ncbi:HEAT repeat domain-containing protein [uncultured Eudoraea sp.]|uniref:HEAT repeat domain-containing protein n=1 Tax=uncultured Eudoraea sp. TaxID=1035614 RepID=UPI0026309EB1|nr:HEAT repeat domain-containing protein [uncultured Eudoraea sp.]
MNLISQTYYSITLISAPKIPTDLLWDLTIVFSGLGIFFLFGVFIFRNRLSNKASKVAGQKKILAPIVSNFLFYETDASKEENFEYINLKIEIRELLKSPFNRLVLTEILLDLEKDLSGDSRDRIFSLYQNLGLHLEAFKKLRSWRWELVSKGILELTQMRVVAAYGFIKKFINDKRGVVRKQAQIATVTLKHEGISYFLDTTRYGISEWQQLKLLDVLRNFDDFSPPRFKAWLTSTNRDVVLFALRLIKHYNQNDASKALIELLKHKNDQIKSEAIQCIKDFGVFEALNMLKTVFRRCSVDIKVQILDAISSLGKVEDIEFLETIVKRESNFLVKSKAISAINVIEPDTYVPTEGIDNYITVENFENNEQDNPTQLSEVMKNSELQPDDSLPASENKEYSLDNQDHLDPEFEDEIIFDLCFTEELEDILSEYNEAEEEVSYLPLDFLPVVSEADELKSTSAKITENRNVETKGNLQEESFKEELEAILNKIKLQEEDSINKDAETPELEFLPLVVEAEGEENIENMVEISAEEILSLEVNAEEVVMTNSEAVVQNSIDWMAFSKEPEVFDNNTYSESLSETPQDDSSQYTSSDNENANNLKEYSGFSIFQELFRTCDKESKLILMDEILAVGDEKEVYFLKTLLNDPDKKIRTKAEKVLKELQSLLTPEIETEEKKDQVQINELDAEDLHSAEEIPEAVTHTDRVPISILDKEEDSLKSMEFCFLSHLPSDDSNNQTQLFQPDFELVETPLEEIEDNLNNNNDNELNEKERKLLSPFLRNIISFSEKFKGKLNG